MTAGLEKEHSWQFHLLSELAGSLDENGVSSIGEVVESAARAGKVPAIVTWLRAIKWMLFSIVGLIVFVGIIYVIVRFRRPIWSLVGGMFRRIRNRCLKNRASIVTSSTARDGDTEGPRTNDEHEIIKLYPDRAEFHLPSHYHEVSSQDANPG